VNLQALVIVFHSWLFGEPSLASLRLCEFRLFVFGQPEQSLFTPHDRLSSLSSSLRCASRGPYTSKYNPIEHRLFPHLTRACQGVIFTSVELVQELMAKTRTKTGLEVAVNILDKVYATGRKVTAQVKEQLRVLFDADLPQWNYRITPWNRPREEVI